MTAARHLLPSRTVLILAAGLATLGAPAFAQEVVGAIGAANAGPTGRAPNKAPRALKPGDDVFFKDHIATRRGGSAQITFLDRSTLNLGENSDVVIDEFVYKPGEAGTMRAKLNKGILRFVGGDISHGGGTTVVTPTVTIGIRGGIGMIGSIKDAAAAASIPGAPRDFKGGTIVVNAYGTLTVRNAASETVIRRPGFAVFVASANGPISAPVRFDMASAQALMKALGSHGGQSGGASAKARAAAAGLAASTIPSMDLPVAHPAPAPVNGLDYTAVFSAGNALARGARPGAAGGAVAAAARACGHAGSCDDGGDADGQPRADCDADSEPGRACDGSAKPDARRSCSRRSARRRHSRHDPRRRRSGRDLRRCDTRRLSARGNPGRRRACRDPRRLSARGNPGRRRACRDPRRRHARGDPCRRSARGNPGRRRACRDPRRRHARGDTRRRCACRDPRRRHARGDTRRRHARGDTRRHRACRDPRRRHARGDTRRRRACRDPRRRHARGDTRRRCACRDPRRRHARHDTRRYGAQGRDAGCDLACRHNPRGDA